MEGRGKKGERNRGGEGERDVGKGGITDHKSRKGSKIKSPSNIIKGAHLHRTCWDQNYTFEYKDSCQEYILMEYHSIATINRFTGIQQ